MLLPEDPDQCIFVIAVVAREKPVAKRVSSSDLVGNGVLESLETDSETSGAEVGGVETDTGGSSTGLEISARLEAIESGAAISSGKSTDSGKTSGTSGGVDTKAGNVGGSETTFTEEMVQLL